MRRYLTGFGPATVAEIANWAGLPSTAIEPVLERLEPFEALPSSTLRELEDEAEGMAAFHA